MPKINVYLPEDLAASVRRAGFPVSPVCQQALADAVRAFTGARKVAQALRDQTLLPSDLAELERAGGPGLTQRLWSVIEQARRDCAADAALVDTRRLLLGLLDEGGNLAIKLLAALDVDLDAMRSSLQADRDADETGAGGDSATDDLSRPARNAIATAIEVAVGFGHNYVGSEHLLVAMVADADSQAGRVLRDHGVETADLRRVLTSAVAGFRHGRQAAGSAADQFEEIGHRLEAIEQRLTAIGA